MISRRMVQSILGLAWFIDGLLQLKPQMFAKAFIQQVVLPTGDGQPHWISSIVHWGADIAIPHLAIWNTLFATTQLLIGLAFLLNFKLKATIVASVVWSAIVWIFGEGFGQILTGQTSLLTGAPGAAVIYALIGIALWTNGQQKPSEWNPKGIRFAQYSLAILFIIGFGLHFQPSYLSQAALSQKVAVPWLANATMHHGLVISLTLALIELAIAVMLIGKFQIHIAVWTSIVLSLVFWWSGQLFGQIFDPLSTDFNSGLLMFLLALCCYPQHLWGAYRKTDIRQMAA